MVWFHIPPHPIQSISSNDLLVLAPPSPDSSSLSTVIYIPPLIAYFHWLMCEKCMKNDGEEMSTIFRYLLIDWAILQRVTSRMWWVRGRKGLMDKFIVGEWQQCHLRTHSEENSGDIKWRRSEGLQWWWERYGGGRRQWWWWEPFSWGIRWELDSWTSSHQFDTQTVQYIPSFARKESEWYLNWGVALPEITMTLKREDENEKNEKEEKRFKR